jgi:hypothetical protein
MASLMLICPWLKFTYVALFTVRVITCIQSFIIEAFDPEESSRFTVYWSVLRVYTTHYTLHSLCAYVGVYNWLQVTYFDVIHSAARPINNGDENTPSKAHNTQGSYDTVHEVFAHPIQ